MQDKNIETKIYQVLAENGILIEDIGWDELIEIDSLSFMSIMVCLEEELKIDIPVEYLTNMRELSCSRLYETIIKIMNK